MTIEIKELVIKAIVDQRTDKTLGQQTQEGTANISDNMTPFDQQQLINICVEQVLAVLDRQRQR